MKIKFFILLFSLYSSFSFAQSSATQTVPGSLNTSGCRGINVPCFVPYSSSNPPPSPGSSGVDGSTTITLGGTAQTLFSGATPTNGFEVCNPDPTNDLWVSDSTTAAANGTGSQRVVANGGCYDSPTGYKPIGAVSIVGAVTGQKITARRW